MSELKLEGLLTVQNGIATFSNNDENGKSRNVKMPRNIQALLGSKVDRLDPQAKLLLSVASVIGAYTEISLFHYILTSF